MFIHRSFSIFVIVLLFHQQNAEKCETSADCESIWPDAQCVRSRCRCPINTIRKKSASREFVCLSVNEANGNAGPPLTCPTPQGAGFQVILRENNQIVQCSTRKKPDSCPDGYECIQGLSILGPLDGVCCPNRDKTCEHPIFDHPDDGRLTRWGFNGDECVQFNWNPERPSTANNFKTRQHCEDYCTKSLLTHHLNNNFH